MFIQTEPTPNPDTLKFLPGRDVMGHADPRDYDSPDAAGTSRLVRGLFAIRGVSRVFLGSDFIAVTKQSEADWAHLNAHTLAAIMDHFVAGLPPVDDDPMATAASGQVYEGQTAEIVKEIRELIDTRVRPAVAQDGGDIVFHSFDAESGVVHLHLRGACSGCPSSTLTLKQGIENLLKTYVPEVSAVEAVL